MDLTQAEDFPPQGFFASSRPAIPENQLSGEKERKNYEYIDSAKNNASNF
jgi:hypothetical protein